MGIIKKIGTANEQQTARGMNTIIYRQQGRGRAGQGEKGKERSWRNKGRQERQEKI